LNRKSAKGAKAGHFLNRTGRRARRDSFLSPRLLSPGHRVLASRARAACCAATGVMRGARGSGFSVLGLRPRRTLRSYGVVRGALCSALCSAPQEMIY
jgi:hypothetical protein